MNDTDGNLSIHLRQFEKNPLNHRIYPTSVGIALRPTRFAALIKVLDQIDACVVKLSSHEECYFKFQQHLGGGIAVNVTSSFKCVNIRKYFVPEGSEVPVPTR